MRHVPTVAWRELRSLFVSPVAYGVLSLFAVLAGLFFVLQVSAFSFEVQRAQQFQAFDYLQGLNLSDHLIRYFYESMTIILLIMIPGITMGLFVAEKTNGTEELLLTSPLTMWDIVLGKFAAGAAFVALLALLVGAFPALLFLYGDPEVGKTLTGLLGVLLVGWTYVAIGTFASSVTRSQVVSFLLALVILFTLWLLPAISQLGVLGDATSMGAVLQWISTSAHLDNLVAGLVDTSDLVYFAVLIGSFLLMTRTAVESVRWR